MSALESIRIVLASYRSTTATITEKQITDAWAEYDQARKALRYYSGKNWDGGKRARELFSGASS
jgi:hypothetical protein